MKRLAFCLVLLHDPVGHELFVHKDHISSIRPAHYYHDHVTAKAGAIIIIEGKGQAVRETPQQIQRARAECK